MRSLYEELEQYINQKRYPFHMPGHKGNPAFLPPSALISLDVTELDETDNLHSPAGCIKETERRIAGLYGADESFLLVNGSTSGIVVAIGAVCGDGDVLAVARNCHRSVFSGMALAGAKPVYFLPKTGSLFAEEVTVKAVADVLKQNPEVKAVVITSPTYEGVVSDIQSIADVVHSRDCILIVDEAHGAHFPFHQAFPKGALLQGADIVVHSFHKTLPAFSQSAAVHVKGQRVDIQRLRQCLSCIQTSSPSYLIMAATDYMLNILQRNPVCFEKYVENLLDLRKTLEEVLLAQPGADISKLVLAVSEGNKIAKESHLAFEMIKDRYILAMTSVADTQAGFDALKTAMKGA
ncbi:MAG: aminotransferase class I/II-fold pyridoxal phosphate-dependent enzyme, partial [Defluviitaleaceae bacterium]|nr:aminotransferase class I/II-fold pyridoxal phosphate-dependent enzyme [Defluviitaleaceae bacterium]